MRAAPAMGLVAGLLAVGVTIGVAAREGVPPSAGSAPGSMPSASDPMLGPSPVTAGRPSPPGASTPSPSPTATVLAPPASAATATPSESSRASSQARLAAAYSRDLGVLAARSGVAVMPVGGDAPMSLGDVGTDVAWSTIKVPITVAASIDRGWPAVRERARPAITLSDNDAATALWNGLGGGTASARKVEAVLAALGDDMTRVSSTATREGFTPFGQTQWSTASQAKVMSGLYCRPDAAATIALMREVVPTQRWGLGQFHGAPIKGGWGPLRTGGYLVRQMGVIPSSRGEVAVAVLVRSPNGFDAGRADLDRITTWLQRHSPDLTGGRCR